MLQTLLRPDEVRDAEFEVLDAEVRPRPQELRMAAALVESLAGDLHPEGFEDDRAAAVSRLVEARLAAAAPEETAAEETTARTRRSA